MNPLFLMHSLGQRIRFSRTQRRVRRQGIPMAALALWSVVAVLTVALCSVYVCLWHQTTRMRRVMVQSQLVDTTPLKSSTFAGWRNKHDIVHVVHTRFMQHQPHLLHLGCARMELFLSITWPSMANQTATNEFLWMIRVDPSLHDSLKQKLLQAMDVMNNLVVILSNENVIDFRQHGTDDIPSEAVLLGRTRQDRHDRMQQVQAYHKAAQNRVVLETRLDADDALSLDLIDDLQNQAGLHLLESNDKRIYHVWCLGTHVEWQFYNPLNESSSSGILVAFPYAHCVTPGLTFGYHVEAQAKDLPTHKHHKIHSVFPQCDKRKRLRCLSVLHKSTGMPLALRARTPTSAGMMNLLTTEYKSPTKLRKLEEWNRFQNQAWREIGRLFAIEQLAVIRLRKKLAEDLPMIAEDNAIGQCTPGHSCKPSSKQILAKIQTSQKI